MMLSPFGPIVMVEKGLSLSSCSSAVRTAATREARTESRALRLTSFVHVDFACVI